MTIERTAGHVKTKDPILKKPLRVRSLANAQAIIACGFVLSNYAIITGETRQAGDDDSDSDEDDDSDSDESEDEAEVARRDAREQRRRARAFNDQLYQRDLERLKLGPDEQPYQLENDTRLREKILAFFAPQ